jgi:hypothetical protein
MNDDEKELLKVGAETEIAASITPISFTLGTTEHS